MYARILVALDGSECSLAGGDIAIALASRLGSEIIATHIFDAKIHTGRFREMEPVLPDQYQDEKGLERLRSAHNGLILEGFQSLSEGYVDIFLTKAKSSGAAVRAVHREGRSFKEIIALAADERADLIILGAHGLGVGKGNESLGSNALRVLRLARGQDVLVARETAFPGPVITGIDGSSEAASALRKALVWARLFSSPLTMAAAYDPFFHNQVFKTMASSLSEERQKEVGLAEQEVLHEQIIDDGLGKLYQTFLDEAHARCHETGISVESVLLQGKAAPVLVGKAVRDGAGLLVVGRYGHHRDDMTGIGSQSETVARMAPCSVLVSAAEPGTGAPEEQAKALEWDDEALQRIERIPPFARPMAKSGIERLVRAKGGTKVTASDVNEAAVQFGMRSPGEDTGE